MSGAKHWRLSVVRGQLCLERFSLLVAPAFNSHLRWTPRLVKLRLAFTGQQSWGYQGLTREVTPRTWVLFFVKINTCRWWMMRSKPSESAQHVLKPWNSEFNQDFLALGRGFVAFPVNQSWVHWPLVRPGGVINRMSRLVGFHMDWQKKVWRWVSRGSAGS